jgi:SAM-dependent methyltransferase
LRRAAWSWARGTLLKDLDEICLAPHQGADSLRPAMNWSVGRYERIAVGLLPAAGAVVEQAAPGEGERVLDVGCGTGNGALLAAERGARVTGIDPAERLLDVARGEARARGLDVQFLLAEAAALPFADAAMDAVISVFGVIFAADPAAVVAELVRVTAPGGRIVISAWIPTGPISDVMTLRREALAGAVTPPGPPPFAWHERDALADAFSTYGVSLELSEHGLAFRASSPAEFIDAELLDHPLWVAAREGLEARQLEAVRRQALEILIVANEEPGAFRLTSRYVVATARRA